MSLHRSLKTQSGGLASHRNVLTRAERIAKLTQEERFDAAKNSALGIVKVRSIKASSKKKKAEEGAEGAAAPAAGAKAPAAGAKAPAAGAKPAAAAAKPAAGAKK